MEPDMETVGRLLARVAEASRRSKELGGLAFDAAPRLDGCDFRTVNGCALYLKDRGYVSGWDYTNSSGERVAYAIFGLTDKGRVLLDRLAAC